MLIVLPGMPQQLSKQACLCMWLQDVYKEMPWHLKEQMEETLAVLKRHPQLGVPH